MSENKGELLSLLKIPPNESLVNDEMNELLLHDKKNDIGFKQDWHKVLMPITVGWVFILILFMWACGRGTLILPESVIVAFITTTSAQIIALPIIMLKYLFPKKS